MTQTKGHVALIGAGPGDAGLFTLRGRELLEAADCVVYDRLVGDGVLAMMPPSAEKINVGKTGGGLSVPQREIEEIIVREAKRGRRVARLKGGDPFMFGRGGEEIEALNREGIPFEVVPGVTSALGGPACAGIPVTHRGIARSVHVITAHTKEGTIAPVDYEALAKLGGSLVFLMGASAVTEICAELQRAGMDGGTPAAAVENASTAAQRLIQGTLGTLSARCAEEKLRSPALIIVGEVTALAEGFAWKRFLPLSGRKVIVTRPRERAGKLSAMLRAKEGSPELTAELAALKINFTELPLYETIYERAEIIPQGADTAVFTSASTVRGFKAAMPELEIECACCIGEQTAAEARRAGFKRIITAQKATLESLINTLEEDIR